MDECTLRPMVFIVVVFSLLYLGNVCDIFGIENECD